MLAKASVFGNSNPFKKATAAFATFGANTSAALIKLLITLSLDRRSEHLQAAGR